MARQGVLDDGGSFYNTGSCSCTSYTGVLRITKNGHQLYSDVRNGNEMVTEMSSRRTELYETVAVLSGLEPQRTILEREVAARYAGKEERVLIVQGLLNRPNTRMKRGNITLVPYLGDEELAGVLHGARHIIARSGYSTIMDLEALGVLEKAELIPTPGQSEQEYLAFWAQKRIIK